MAEALTPYREAGRCRVLIDYRNDRARAELLLGEDWRVRPAPELLERLEELAGDVQLLYR
ncbi:MAG: hypothetical protein R3310_14405 [Candidatus Competibacteraceae bacterium]|nr:hypothetical protein [Candidatus Competibacteraceae bacterium]